ncbi:hypothetical protein Q5752_006871 [Cryptotrichosporon argae]
MALRPSAFAVFRPCAVRVAIRASSTSTLSTLLASPSSAPASSPASSPSSSPPPPPPPSSAPAASAASSLLGSVNDLLNPAGPSRTPPAPSTTSSSIPASAFTRGSKLGSLRPSRPRGSPVYRAPGSFPSHLSLPSSRGDATHVLSVRSSRNNVHLVLSDAAGPVTLGAYSAGSGKAFKGAARSSYEAAHQAALKIFERTRDVADYYRTQGNDVRLVVAYKGLQGQGREAVHAALSGPEGEEVRSLVGTANEKRHDMHRLYDAHTDHASKSTLVASSPSAGLHIANSCSAPGAQVIRLALPPSYPPAG